MKPNVKPIVLQKLYKVYLIKKQIPILNNTIKEYLKRGKVIDLNMLYQDKLEVDLRDICLSRIKILHNNLRIARELGLSIDLSITNNVNISVLISDPKRNRNKNFYESDDDIHYKQIANRLETLYKLNYK